MNKIPWCSCNETFCNCPKLIEQYNYYIKTGEMYYIVPYSPRRSPIVWNFDISNIQAINPLKAHQGPHNGALGIGESNEIRRTSGPYKVNQNSEPDRSIDETLELIKACEKQLDELPAEYIRIALPKYKKGIHAERHNCHRNKPCSHPKCILEKLTKVIDDYSVYSQTVGDEPFSKSDGKQNHNRKKEHHTKNYLSNQFDKHCAKTNKIRVNYKRNQKHNDPL